MKKIIWIIAISIPIISIFMLPTIVKADELQNWSSSQSRYRYDDHGTDRYSAWETTPHTWEPTLPVNKMQWRVKATDGLKNENTYIIKFAYRPIPQAITPTKIQVYADTGTVAYEEITCGQWAYNEDNFNVVKCTFTPKNNISSNTWLIIEVNFTQEYLTSIRSYMNKYEERKSTNAVITEQTIDLINNSNQNTQEIINNINQANENLLEGLSEQNQVCSYIDYKFIKTNKKYLNNNGELIDDLNYGVTDYININSTKVDVVENNQSWTSPNICFYNHNKSLISCTITNSGLGNVMIPNNTYYARFSINSENHKPVYKICRNGNQAIQDTLNQDHDYNNTMTDQTLIDNMEQKENEILEYLNLDPPDDLIDITINPTIATFIWDIINRIRLSSSYITLLFTSILSLGVIKLVLNR